MIYLCCAMQDGRNAEIAAIRSGFADVVEIVTRVNSVRTSSYLLTYYTHFSIPVQLVVSRKYMLLQLFWWDVKLNDGPR